MKEKLQSARLFIMQKWLIIPLIVLGIVGLTLLATSFAHTPSVADDGAAWGKDWEMLGTAFGVEPPGNGLTLLNNDTALAGDDTYYASWVCGEAEPYVNAEGKDVDLYPAQVYLLVYGCADADAANEALADWTARAEETYTVTARRDETHNGQAFSLLIYDCGSDTNPYSRGVSAFGRFGHYAIIAELTCTDAFTGDPERMLAEFLDGCHYSTAALK